ncbi:putative KNTase [Vibrio nigripulchritudo SFn27]|uniref:Putative KNTase n=1 Tax=Vibrio nigripulchritudo TaxID=28173 RepID=U4KFD7_9VIBR|nr:nucleotidyltransferase domain-containing protein [Vibrio nigripulchritudo]CCN85664.1 putative KNTase [Vibrio nigripulchritudo BLFn1]CCN91076.1 putative KNTase [Vibrio nigripulchritudo SFn27]CCN93550.1 putative KNTase [Vibrio nigripulchritudo ENn2]CCO40083.1 putative KNTase [Vibrio nigripulchritudo SFn135]CCO54155.1 putative KNTase [Vibrio nigripulchritudo Wn13]
MDNSILIRESINILRTCIDSNNLLFAFISGSRAKECYRDNSDVDLFVVLKEPNRVQETTLANELIKFHLENSLQLSHCGQILDEKTLYSIIHSSKNMSNLVYSGIENTACYHTDCILSITRKVKVVLHMLKMPKIGIIGDIEKLSKYEDYANSYYHRTGEPSKQLALGKMVWGDYSQHDDFPKSIWDKYLDKLASGDIANTPLGIGLHRWFRDPIPKEVNLLVHKFNYYDESTCPLSSHKFSSTQRNMIASQCIGCRES